MELTRARRLLENSPAEFDTNRWTWREDRVQTRARDFEVSVAREFERGWTVLCERSSVLGTPNSYWMDEIGDRLVLIVRGNGEELRGFYNVCPHQGAPLERMRCGIKKRFSCPYHAFSFDTDGRLRSVPLKEGYDESWFRKEDYSLQQIGVREVGGLVTGSLSRTGNTEIGEVAKGWLESLFPVRQKREVIFRCNVSVEGSWLEWMKRSRETARGFARGSAGDTRSGGGAERGKVLEDGADQVVMVKGFEDNRLLEVSGLSTAGWGDDAPKELSSAGWLGCILHVAPNSVIVSMYDSLVTLRVDPVDEEYSLVWVTGYGTKEDGPESRQRRQRQMQLWWGPYGSYFRTVGGAEPERVTDHERV